MQDLACIILAAGKGTRMRSSVPKVMHSLAGRPMISWLLDAAQSLEPSRTIVVTGPDMDTLAAAAAPHTLAVQEVRNGTAGAARAALPALEGFEGRVMILMGDEPLVDREALRALRACDSPLTVMGVDVPDPGGLGRLVMDESDRLARIIEASDASAQERALTLCNTGNYCVDAALFRSALPEITNDNAKGELYLTDIVGIARRRGVDCAVVRTQVSHGWGINDRLQLAEHEKALQDRLRAEHMRSGVTLTDPGSVFFSWDTRIGRDVTVGPGVTFGPGVVIEDGANILPYCHIEGARIEGGACVGPFARLRPGTTIEEGGKVGNFVEIKNASLGAGSKVNHLSYVGDAQTGAACNIGAGTIFCNYDGTHKHHTTLSDDVFVGSNSTLVAPVTIGKGAYVAAGSVITLDVPEDSLAVARNRPIIREDWAARRREKQEKD